MTLFLGESGAGKSTLAARLPTLLPPAERVADDIVPVRVAGDTLVCLPHFPQLKLGPGGQYGPQRPERPAVTHVCVLEPVAESTSTTAGTEPLDPAAAALALVRHTASARLFPGALLAGHLAACGAMAQRVPVRRAVYPHREDAIAQASGWVIRAFPGLHAATATP